MSNSYYEYISSNIHRKGIGNVCSVYRTIAELQDAHSKDLLINSRSI